MAGLQFGLGFAKTIFWGLDFRKTETNLFLHFVRAEEGSGEESARASSDFFGERALIPKGHKVGTLIFLNCSVKYIYRNDKPEYGKNTNQQKFS